MLSREFLRWGCYHALVLYVEVLGRPGELRWPLGETLSSFRQVVRGTRRRCSDGIFNDETAREATMIIMKVNRRVGTWKGEGMMAEILNWNRSMWLWLLVVVLAKAFSLFEGAVQGSQPLPSLTCLSLQSCKLAD